MGGAYCPGILFPGIFVLGVILASLGCESPDSVPSDGASPSNHSLVADEQQGFWVQVEITGFRNREGKCRVAAYDSDIGFQDPDKAVTREVLGIEGDSIRWSFRWRSRADGGSPKSLAISAYHDENDNGQLDKSLIGMPTERYGFSNSPKRGYGPPTFKQAAVAIPEESSASTPWLIPLVLK